MDAKQKMRKARANLILDKVFFGSLALKLEMIENNEIKTGCVNGKQLKYNSKFVDDLTIEETKGFVGHEVLHCALLHHLRRNNRDVALWNKACDYVINLIGIENGFVLPPGALVDNRFLEMSVDEVYRILQEEQTKENPQDKNNKDDENSKDKKQEKSDQGENGKGQPTPDPGGCGAVEDAIDDKGETAIQPEIEKQESDWKVNIAQAAQQAKAAGQLSGGLKRLVEEIINPKVDWQDVLRQFLEMNAKNDYSMFPPNRRYLAQGLYLPSLRSQELPEIVIGVDTSISIREMQLNEFAAEMSSILEEYNTTITVIYCDSSVKNVEVFTSWDLPIKLNAQGGGGTRFSPVFRYVENEGLEPKCLVYLTDMECRDFGPEPDYPVLWIKTGKYGTSPPFGEVVEM